MLVLRVHSSGMAITVSGGAARLVRVFSHSSILDGCIYDDEDVKRVKFAYNQGHMVASHTWAHKDLTTLSSKDINSEMSRVEDALDRIIGVRPAFTRPPYGNYNDLVRKVAKARGQKLVTWDFDSGDSTGSTPARSKAAYDTVAKQHPSTILALNHETYGAYIDYLFGLLVSNINRRVHRTHRPSLCHQVTEG
jgi:peptidoglycan/xylan/chitin deacetylase (PgdA/CDA1 family)